MKVLQKIRYGICRLLGRHPSAILNCRIHKTAAVGNGAKLVNCTMGRYSYLYGSSAAYTEIGAFCSIATGCSIGGGSHPANWTSTSPVFYKGKNVLKKNFSQNAYAEYEKTVIGNDVWIGANCLIKGGVTIGNGAVIGMGSVVTKDVPAYEIWAGNPAKCIRKRFDDETIAKLLKLQWWDWGEAKLQEHGSSFSDPQKLLEKLEED